MCINGHPMNLISFESVWLLIHIMCLRRHVMIRNHEDVERWCSESRRMQTVIGLAADEVKDPDANIWKPKLIQLRNCLLECTVAMKQWATEQGWTTPPPCISDNMSAKGK